MGGRPYLWVPDASSETVLSIPCGHQVEGEENMGLLQGQKGSKWGKIPVVTGLPKCHRVPPSLAVGVPPGKLPGLVLLPLPKSQ